MLSVHDFNIQTIVNAILPFIFYNKLLLIDHLLMCGQSF